jgi:putative transposase
MCQFMKVSRSGYYEWLNSAQTAKKKQDEEFIKIIKPIFKEGRSTYGTRRIKKKLALQNKTVSRRRIGRLMEEAGLACRTKRKFKATTDSKHTKFIAPNLLGRQFNIAQKNRCWVGDITFIPTKEGWLYLAVVIDLYSRQVIGWSMNSRMKAGLVNKALLMAIWRRKPTKGLIWHTDRGSQYASDSHRRILGDHRIIQSMSRKGDCWDNAVAESFFHTLKTELTHHYKFKNTEEAKQAVFNYIEVFYNRIRIHSANDYLSPADYEAIQKVA